MAAKKFYYGGQAVIEGVMMRGQKNLVTVVRRPNGTLAVDKQSLAKVYTGWARRAPLIRGVIVLIEALVLGIKTMLYSANVSLEEEDVKISGGMVWLLLLLSLGLAVAVFFVAPLFLTKLLNIESAILFNLVEGVIRAVIFIAYLKLMTLMPDIRRVFAYHGAEHKAVNAYEAGVPLEIESVKRYSTAHVRCGTSFLFSVLVISIIVFSLIGVRTVWLMAASRIVLVPVIAAIGYEFIYFGARHVNNGFIRAIITPGLWLQSLTTREPDDSQLEVALSAMRMVAEADQEQAAVVTADQPPAPAT